MSDFIIADDLSGALDAAGAFHRAGHRVTIVLAAEAWPRAGGAGLVAFTTETRNADAATAARAVRQALAQGHGQGGRLLYKKIDSTLRGPVAAELAALAEAMPAARILFAPANPAVGRTVCDGVLLVRGVPVAETEYGRDPVSPVHESLVRRLLGAAATERVEIADAATEPDLERAVAAMVATTREWVGVGSGALARPIAARHAVRGGGHPGPSPAFPPGPVLMVCGSAHAGNREQAAVLRRERGVPVFEVPVATPDAEIPAVVECLRAGPGATLMLETRRRESAAALRAMTTAASLALAASGVRRVFVTGGETAYALCQALRLQILEFEAEIEPGLSVARGGGRPDAPRFAIKPGGFGNAATWVLAWDALQAVT